MEVYDRMNDSTVRIEGAWPFPVYEPSESLAKAFEDMGNILPPELRKLVSSWDEEDISTLFGGYGDSFRDSYNQLCSEAFDHEVSGWIGIAATPLMKRVSETEGNAVSYSWGRFKLTVLFAPTADALLEAAVQWADKEYERSVGRERVT